MLPLSFTSSCSKKNSGYSYLWKRVTLRSSLKEVFRISQVRMGLSIVAQQVPLPEYSSCFTFLGFFIRHKVTIKGKPACGWPFWQFFMCLATVQEHGFLVSGQSSKVFQNNAMFGSRYLIHTWRNKIWKSSDKLLDFKIFIMCRLIFGN